MKMVFQLEQIVTNFCTFYRALEAAPDAPGEIHYRIIEELLPHEVCASSHACSEEHR